MPDILIKNEVGEDVEYDDVESVTLRLVDGGSVTYTYGVPDPTQNWRSVQSLLDNPTYTSYWARSYVSVPTGKLVSCSAPKFGTWFQSSYDAFQISKGVFTQFIVCDNGVLLATANYNAPIYFYDYQTKTVEKINNTGGSFTNSFFVGSKVFIASGAGWLLFNPETKEVTSLLSFQSPTIYSYFVEDGVLIAPTSSVASAYSGMYFLSNEDYSLTHIFTEGYAWLTTYRNGLNLQSSAKYGVLELDDCYLISSSESATSCKGILRFDKETHEVVRLSSIGFKFFYEREYSRLGYTTNTRIIKEHGVAICNNNDTTAGLWWYSFGTKELTQIVPGTSVFSYWVENDDMVIGTNSSYGCVVYNKETKTWYRPATSGLYYYAAFVRGGIVIVSSTASLGCRYYDIEAKTLTTINTSYQWYRCLKVPGGCLVTSSASNTGVWFFDETEKTLTKVYNDGYYWIPIRWGNNVLLGSYSTSVYGFLFYKDKTFTYSRPNTNDKSMRCIIPVNDGWLIGQSSTYSYAYFVDGETGETSVVSTGVNSFVTYGNIYGSGDIVKKTYNFNVTFDNYRIITSYDGRGFIFDEITHKGIPFYTWAESQAQPSTTKTDYMIAQKAQCFKLTDDFVFILNGTSQYSYGFDLEKGVGYTYSNFYCYCQHSYNQDFQPIYRMIPTDGGYLLFFPPVEKEQYNQPYTAAAGIFYINTETKKLHYVYKESYFDTFEETEGGGIIYNSFMPYFNRVYWDAETHTCTLIQN